MELSLLSFGTDDISNDGTTRPSWAEGDRLNLALENQGSPKFGPIGKVYCILPNSDVPMPALTPLSEVRKRHRAPTPRPGVTIQTVGSPFVPLLENDKGNNVPWLDRMRSRTKVRLLSGPSLSSEPARRKPRSRRPRKQAPIPQPSLSDDSLSLVDIIHQSYLQFARHIPLEIGSSTEGQFNMFRVSRNDKRAILTPKIINELLQEAEGISNDIWSSTDLDDSGLRSKLGSGGKDFLDLPRAGTKIMDVASEIQEKIDINNASAMLWKFFRYFVLRVEDAATAGNSELQKEIGRHGQDIAMVYECLLGIFYQLGPVSYGRQLSLLNSLCGSACQLRRIRTNIG